MHLLCQQGSGAGTFETQLQKSFLLILQINPIKTYHGRQSDVARAALIPHSNRQLEWEYLCGKKNRLRDREDR